jgi:hypothetical protein
MVHKFETNVKGKYSPVGNSLTLLGMLPVVHKLKVFPAVY